MKKQQLWRIIALVLTICLLSGAVGAIGYTAGSSRAAEKTSEGSPSPAAEKEETVYVLANADGSVQRIIVSDWLKNPNAEATLIDKSELDDIENIKNDAGYTIDADNQRIWEANGEDIYYQGSSDKPLPVELQLTYRLDGVPISAEDLAGKSGKVTIRFDYCNKEFQNVMIDGGQERIYVPFLMLTGMILDTETFTNITVSNGKVLNDGNRCMVIGFALPGMQENLSIDPARFELPSYVEVTADVTDFSLSTTMTLATNEIFRTAAVDSLSADDLDAAVANLTSAVGQLIDGSSQLYDGLSTLLDKSDDLIDGINALYVGADALNTGADTLKEGASSLSDGAAALNSGLGQLNAGSAALVSGADQVFASLLAAADAQLAAAGLSAPALTKENYVSVLQGVLASLDADTVYNMAYNTALNQVTQAVCAQEPTVRAAVTSAIRERALEAVLSAGDQPMSVEQYMEAVSAGLISAEQQAQIQSAVDAQMATEEVQAQIDAATQAQIQALIDSNMASTEVQSQIAAAVTQAESGANSLQTLLTQLQSYESFYSGLVSYTDGVSSAYEGSQTLTAGSAALKVGASDLSDGANQLYQGLGRLSSGSDALKQGVQALTDGAMQLSDGMREFSEQGLEPIVQALNGDMKLLLLRVQAMLDVSAEYQSFGGISEEMSGVVRFIYRTDSISVKDSAE